MKPPLVRESHNAINARSMRARRIKLIRDNPRLWLLGRARRNARKHRLPFDLTIDDIHIPSVCPVLGIKLAWSDNDRDDSYPSVDKVIPELGYVKGNVSIISWRANWLKSNATLDELKALVVYVSGVHDRLYSDAGPSAPACPD